MKLTLVWVLILLIGCKVSEKTYKKIATDTQVTSEKKAIIAPWVSVHFPVTNEVIKGDDVVTLDTMWVAYTYTDTIRNVDTIVQRVTKTIHRTDTIKVEDYSKLLISRREATQLQAEVIIEQQLRRQAELDRAKVKERQRNLWFVIIALSLALGFSVYMHLKKIL